MTPPSSDRPSGSAPQPPDWTAIARHLDGESDAAEAERVRGWLVAHPGDAELLDALEARVGRAAFAAREAAASRTIDVDGALARVTTLRDKDPMRLSTWRGVPSIPARAWWKHPALAAAAVLVVAVGLYLARDGRVRDDGAAPATEPLAASYETGTGERRTHQLPDGSTVVLGPRSALVLHRFDAGARQLELTGEGHFVVRHDAARPFTVHAGGATIVDIGTAFTVRSGDARTRVAVTEGVVEMRAGTALPGSGVVLRRGDVATLDASGAATVQRAALAPSDTAWTSGRLVFRDAPMSEVARELYRWYGVRLRIADSSLARLHYNDDVAGVPVARVLDNLAAGLGARLEMRGDTAILHRR